MGFLETIKQEWPVITAAPVTFSFAVIGLTGVVTLAIWRAYAWAYGARLERRDDHIKGLERQLAELSDQKADPLASSPTKQDEPPNWPPKPYYTAWRHINEFTIEEAASLWCDVEPKTGLTTPHIGIWRDVFKAAVKSGELDIAHKVGAGLSARAHARENPDHRTSVTRASLKKFAERHRHDPPFLRDDVFS